MTHFKDSIVARIAESPILGIRVGSKHRVIGIWVVVVEGRVFVRSWTLKKDGWYRTSLEQPEGLMTIGKTRMRVRMLRTRSERLKAAIDRAYAEKYHTPASQKYVRGFRTKRRRDTTTELVPFVSGV